MRTGERIGMLGGTFDPVHIGHAIVARDVLEALELERLLVVPAARPPHREALFPAELRLAWARAVFDGAPGLEVSDLELRRDAPSYTVDTLARLREARRPRELHLVIGADQLRLLPTWHRYERLAELARIVVMERAGERVPEGEATLPYEGVEVTRIDLSSTRVRERLRANRPIRFLVPEPIREEVEEAWRARRASGAAERV